MDPNNDELSNDDLIKIFLLNICDQGKTMSIITAKGCEDAIRQRWEERGNRPEDFNKEALRIFSWIHGIAFPKDWR